MKHFIITALCLMDIFLSQAQTPSVKPPVMGWASWNNYHVNITENIIKAQVDAMSENGMRDAGYLYINIDDGFFGGRDSDGNLLYHQERFPNGMRELTDYIHLHGLKAGTYSDAGINTCGSHYDKDTVSVGCGLYGHEHQDLKRMLCEWNFDFIKVDWCGGDWMGLDEQARYTEIAHIIRSLKPETVYNVCRWQFPGTWVTHIADSWRISGDIRASFKSVMNIVDQNADLWKYCSPGHYNDMDMLQVGRGMSYEEDKTHFTMWCIMVSPLLAGNDLSKMSKETISILTNKEIIALNQDPLYYQARRIVDNGDIEIWGKPLQHTMSGIVAVTLLNRSETKQDVTFSLASLGIDASASYTFRDLWKGKNYPSSKEEHRTFSVPSHGVITLLIKGKSLPFNIFQKK